MPKQSKWYSQHKDKLKKSTLYTIALDDSDDAVLGSLMDKGNPDRRELFFTRNQEKVVLVTHGTASGCLDATRTQVMAADIIICCHPATVIERVSKLPGLEDIAQKFPPQIRNRTEVLWVTVDNGRLWVSDKKPF